MTDYPGALHAFIDASGKADTALSSEHVAAHVELADELTANAAFLAATNPTTAQAVAQVKALTRQVNALIRLVGRDLLSTDGT